MNRLIIIDGHAILHRAYHALPPLTTTKGLMVNAVYGFTSMILRVVAELHPVYLIIAFDTPEPTFRNKIYKDYQIQRPKADDDFISQIDIVKKVTKEMGIECFEKPGFEADDVIGTIAFKAIDQFNKERKTKHTVQKLEVIIVTGDRDMLQLVNDKVKIYMPVKGLSESKMFGESEVLEKFGVKPSQIVDYKALVGDPSDNYPGVIGVGPKTAATLIRDFGSLEKLYQNLDKINNKTLIEKLLKNEELAKISKKLAQIITDVPLKINWDRCVLKNFNRDDVYLLFDELEFRSLIPRLSGSKEQRANNKKNKIEKDELNKADAKNTQQISLFN